MVEDVDCENVLYHDYFILKPKYSEEEHHVTFYVPLYEPLPPNYFIKVISDRWLHSGTTLPVTFKRLILPEKYATHTELLDLQPLPIASLRNQQYEALYKGQFNYFNPIQTQVFNSLYNSDSNTFVGARTGSGKTICAEFAILRLFNSNPKAKCVYVAPYKETVDERYADWAKRFAPLHKEIVVLTGESTADLKVPKKPQIRFLLFLAFFLP